MSGTVDLVVRQADQGARSPGGTPSISVVTPTWGRERLLPHLVECFRSQTLPALELIILDDSPLGSSFLESLGDPRVTYLRGHARETNGAKRDTLIRAARGDVIAYFDDDDYYAPGYLEFMVNALGGADLVTLSSWYNYWVRDGGVYFWDTCEAARWHRRIPPAEGQPRFFHGNRVSEEVRRGFTLGYGFSYVFRREMGVRVGVPDMAHGSDYTFVKQAIAAGYAVHAVPDEVGRCLHMIHGDNVSLIFPQYALPPFVARQLFGDTPERYARSFRDGSTATAELSPTVDPQP